MDTIEIEAMLVRADGAKRLVKEQDIDFYEAIILIVAPTEEVLSASMQAAAASGPGYMARRLSRIFEGSTQPRRGVVRAPRTPEQTLAL